MNYLRGALNAASQYYKDLPPINPATLTGAIDVIVIERRNERGDVELACSPFHVRFGKWQVLRPAEKQVTVLLNGHPIPYKMKIGDAGEAFFVFETEEDVPEDLITSPLLQPIQDTGLEKPPVDESGRFGAREDKPSTPSTNLPEEPFPEPEFLDLNSSSQDPSKVPEQQDSTTQQLKPQTKSHPPSITSSESTAVDSAQQSHASAGSAVAAIKTTAVTVRDLATHIPRIVRTGSSSSSPASIGPSVKDAEDMLSPADEDVQAPDVTYHRDVVLDLSGYHSKGPSERTITADDKWDENSDPKDSNAPSPEPSRTPSPDLLEEPSDVRPVRATSAPPEYGASTSPPPEYSWDWGAFPQRSPTNEAFPPFPTDRPERRSRPSTSKSPRSRSPIPEADGGKLEADSDDPLKIWLDFEGQRFSFELSLCDGGSNNNRMQDIVNSDGKTDFNDDPLQVAKRFDAKRVTFQTLLDDENVLHSKHLAVRWDDEYIYRSDNSPLLTALVKWRRRTVAEAERKTVENVPSPAVLSASPTILSPIHKPAVRSRTWSRWWSRSYTASDAQPQAHSISTPVSASTSVDKLVSSTVPTRAATPDVIQQPLPPSSVPFPQQQAPVPHHGKKYAKTLRLTSDQLKTLNLNKGANSITFSLSATGQVACTARIFVWNSTDQIVVSDIDGTITKSDALGHVFTLIGRDWTHLGVAKLYSDIFRNGYKIMYLTSRAIGQADSTRDYLKGINQNNYQLPEGPVIMSPDRLLTSLHREVIMRKPEVFKMACLKDIRRLFGTTSHKAFYAGFGNRITDALSYRSVDIPSARIFTIDSSGEVKMELLELAGYKSSYIHMTDLVDQMFPPINRKWAPEYTDFNYWRTPIPDIELPELSPTPPSPSLSASGRSDASMQSTLSRLRHFSLGRSLSRAQSPDGSSSLSSKDSPSDILPDNHNNNYNHDNTTPNNKHIRSAASLDRFGAYLPSLGSTDGMSILRKPREEEEEVVFVPNGWGTAGYRKGRPGSMPGSLDLTPNIQDPRWFEDDSGDDLAGGGDERGEGSEINHNNYSEEQGTEQTFDDDLIATGEMENVPYL